MHTVPNTQYLIACWRDGQDAARDSLIVRLLPELSAIAAARMRGEVGSSLSTSDLINDAVVKMMRIESIDLTDRAHFVALASRLMRNILTDHARAKSAGKRAHYKVELTTQIDGGQRFDLQSLDSALIRLGAMDPELMEIVEMRYFGGMTVTDIALVTGLSEPTVKRRWQTARAWLTSAVHERSDD